MKKRTKIILGAIGGILLIIAITLGVMYKPSLSHAELSKYAHKTLKLDNGMQVNYKIAGNPNGKPILFVHGGSDNLATWDLWSEKLREYKLISVDLPGHGLTDAFPKELTYSAQNMANFIEKFTNSMNLKRFVLVAHSMGGEYSMKFTIEHPEKVEALTLLSPGCYRDGKFESTEEEKFFKLAKSPFGKVIPYFMPNPFNEEFLEKYIGPNFMEQYKKDKSVFQGGELIRYEKNRESMLRLVVGMYDKPFLEGIPTIKKKALILWGDKDKIADVNRASRLNKDLENSKLVIYPNVGHTLQVDYPESVNDFIGFLKNDIQY